MTKLTWHYEKGRMLGMNEEGDQLAKATWEVDGNLWNVDHTFVDTSLRGQGVAGQMMKEIMTYAKKEGVKVYGTCSYADNWISRHKEDYADVVCDRPDGKGVGCKIA